MSLFTDWPIENSHAIFDLSSSVRKKTERGNSLISGKNSCQSNCMPADCQKEKKGKEEHEKISELAATGHVHVNLLSDL